MLFNNITEWHPGARHVPPRAVQLQRADGGRHDGGRGRGRPRRREEERRGGLGRRRELPGEQYGVKYPI